MRRLCLLAVLSLSCVSAACSRGSDASSSTEQSVESTLPAPSKLLKVTKVATLPNLPAKSAFTENDPQPIVASASPADIIVHGGAIEPALLRFDDQSASLTDYTDLDIQMINNAPNWAFSASKKNLAFYDNTPKPDSDTSLGQTLHIKDLKSPTAPPITIDGVQGYRWVDGDKLVLQTKGRVSKIDPSNIENPIFSYELANGVDDAALAPRVQWLANGLFFLAFTEKEAKVIRVSDGFAWQVTGWKGHADFNASDLQMFSASTGKDFMALYASERGQPGSLVQIGDKGSFKLLTDQATTIYGSTADRLMWGTPNGFTVHNVAGYPENIDFEVANVDFAQLVGDGFVYYETTTNDSAMFWRRKDDGTGEAKKLIPDELVGDLHGLGFIPGPTGFFIASNNKLWKTDFTTGKYEAIYDDVVYTTFQPVMNQEPANEPAVVVTAAGEGLALVPAKGKAATLVKGQTHTWAGGWTNGVFVYATDQVDPSGVSHFQLHAVTNEGLEDSVIGPVVDELVIHRSGASLSRVLLRQGKDLLSVTVDATALPEPPAEVPLEPGQPAPVSDPVNHHAPGGNPILPAPGSTPATPPAAAAKDDSGCTVSHSKTKSGAPALILLGLGLVAARRRRRV